ncbi:MAG TPA: 3-phosphoshikimate 1-carboxyvinyltransferase [Pyrinomonadaceae bacterium]|jgi:3-phosphoshikimate 1-carboxyvinyltransferase|nr:3-phosphoshikimate 1-carboxyvinyltransferase [Pyrinomonadaceae bacterium]
MRIQPADRLSGRVRVPGDKSISHRAAIIAALTSAGARSRLTNYSASADCASTLHCLAALGVRIEREGDTVEVEGAGTRMAHAPREPLDCGNSGTTMRLLAGLLAGQPFAATLTGDDSLRSRPMKRIIEPLELMGARVSSAEGRAPLRIEGRAPLAPIRYALPVASAQVKSCILLAGLNARGRTEVVEARGATRDHTERLLSLFGADVRTELKDYEGRLAPVVSLETPASLLLRPPPEGTCNIAGDISSAAFFLAAAALLPGSDLTLAGVGLNPTRTGILDTLQSLGADVVVTDKRAESGEETGELRVRGHAAGLSPATANAKRLGGELIANLIDELPILCVLGTQVEGGLEIRDAAELRVKETDRIGAMVTNLRALGAEVEEYADGLSVGGRTRLRGARLESFGDHRIAMACAVAALISEGESELEGAEAVAVSLPEFFGMLESVIER